MKFFLGSRGEGDIDAKGDNLEPADPDRLDRLAKVRTRWTGQTGRIARGGILSE